MLLQLSQFSPFDPLPQATPHSHSQSPQYCSCPWAMHIRSLSYPFTILRQQFILGLIGWYSSLGRTLMCMQSAVD